MTYDTQDVAKLRKMGTPWSQIGEVMGITGNAARKRFARSKPKPSDSPNSETEQQSEQAVTSDTVEDAGTIDDIIAGIKERSEDWDCDVAYLRGSEWDMANGKKGRSWKVGGTFKRKVLREGTMTRLFADLIADAEAYAPAYPPLPESLRPLGYVQTERPSLLAEFAINDAHFGMLAHGDETGKGHYDLGIARENYINVATRMVTTAKELYGDDIERCVFLVGNDLFHANSYAPGSRQAVTRAGTPQDVDTRLHEVFTAVRRAVVEATECIMYAIGAPVDIVIVPGNHDMDETYRLGEVLAAWFRGTSEVSVDYGANKRKFYGWRGNAFMFTHGEEYKRQRENLAMLFLNEMPASMFLDSKSGLREVHTGHNHAAMQGGYYPTAELTESQGIRVRSLPGLTGTDAWHHEQGYQHHRAATLLMYRGGGGLHALHEVTP